MKILLTGATGFLGWRTLEKLVDLEEVTSIIATGRSIKATHYVEHPKAIYILGDLSDENFVNKLVTDVDFIIHAAGLSSPWGTEKEFIQANLIPQQLLIKAAKDANIKRFVFISTPSLYFELRDKFQIKESDPLPNPFINHYCSTKRNAEIALEKSGISYVILRPRALTGRGDTVIMPRLIRACDEGKLKVIGNGQNSVDLTAVSNVVDAILLGLSVGEKGINKTYNITNGSPVKLWDSIAYLLPKVKREMPQKKIPFSVAVNIARVLEWVSRLTTQKEPALTVYSIGILAMNFTLDISKAKKYLGYQPKATSAEALDEFAQWFMENEQNHPKS
tara:strand:+ start:55365 stop:56366 length:1002 start_codon:yes stop_codon:yes gene_type:complete